MDAICFLLGAPSFAEDISALFKRYVAVLVAVQDHCITGGPEEFFRAYMNSEGVSFALLMYCCVTAVICI